MKKESARAYTHAGITALTDDDQCVNCNAKIGDESKDTWGEWLYIEATDRGPTEDFIDVVFLCPKCAEKIFSNTTLKELSQILERFKDKFFEFRINRKIG